MQGRSLLRSSQAMESLQSDLRQKPLSSGGLQGLPESLAGLIEMCWPCLKCPSSAWGSETGRVGMELGKERWHPGQEQEASPDQGTGCCVPSRRQRLGPQPCPACRPEDQDFACSRAQPPPVEAEPARRCCPYQGHSALGTLGMQSQASRRQGSNGVRRPSSRPCCGSPGSQEPHSPKVNGEGRAGSGCWTSSRDRREGATSRPQGEDRARLSSPALDLRPATREEGWE